MDPKNPNFDLRRKNRETALAEYSQGVTILTARPSRISFDPGSICNLKCVQCFREHPLNGFVEQKAEPIVVEQVKSRGHVVLGALVNLAAAERMDALLADAKAKGGVVVAGGGRQGAVVEATVVDRVMPEMRIYGEESFGPVKPIIRVRGEEEAVRVDNDTEYGLSSAIFSRTSSARCASTSAFNRASATSTARPFRTRRRCPSAA